jgi:hypothetical protein
MFGYSLGETAQWTDEVLLVAPLDREVAEWHVALATR